MLLCEWKVKGEITSILSLLTVRNPVFLPRWIFCGLQEGVGTPDRRKDLPPKTARFNPLSLVRIDLPISRIVFESLDIPFSTLPNLHIKRINLYHRKHALKAAPVSLQGYSENRIIHTNGDVIVATIDDNPAGWPHPGNPPRGAATKDERKCGVGTAVKR
jgi:hypothetical protein